MTVPSSQLLFGTDRGQENVNRAWRKSRSNREFADAYITQGIYRWPIPQRAPIAHWSLLVSMAISISFVRILALGLASASAVLGLSTPRNADLEHGKDTKIVILGGGVRRKVPFDWP